MVTTNVANDRKSAAAEADYLKVVPSVWEHALVTSKIKSNLRLAKATDLSPSTVYATRRGLVPSRATREKIARALGVEHDHLFVHVVDVEAE